jgi:hypothetical protein
MVKATRRIAVRFGALTLAFLPLAPQAAAAESGSGTAQIAAAAPDLGLRTPSGRSWCC